MLVTPLKQIALNGNRREELPGLSRTWAGDIMSLMLPHCLLGDSPVCAVVHCTGSTAAAGVLFVIQKRCLRHCWGLCLAAHFAQLGDELHPLGPSLLEGCKLLHQR